MRYGVNESTEGVAPIPYAFFDSGDNRGVSGAPGLVTPGSAGRTVSLDSAILKRNSLICQLGEWRPDSHDHVSLA